MDLEFPVVDVPAWMTIPRTVKILIRPVDAQKEPFEAICIVYLAMGQLQIVYRVAGEVEDTFDLSRSESITTIEELPSLGFRLLMLDGAPNPIDRLVT